MRGPSILFFSPLIDVKELGTFPPVVLPPAIRQAFTIPRPENSLPESTPDPALRRFNDPAYGFGNETGNGNGANNLTLRVPTERRSPFRYPYPSLSHSPSQSQYSCTSLSHSLSHSLSRPHPVPIPTHFLTFLQILCRHRYHRLAGSRNTTNSSQRCSRQSRPGMTPPSQ